MTSDWVNDVKDAAVSLITQTPALEVSCHDSEPDLSNPTASEIATLSRDRLTMADWQAITTDGIYRQAVSDVELDFGVAGEVTTIEWVVVWDASTGDGDGDGDGDGAPSTTPLGKLQLIDPKPIGIGDPVKMPAGNLRIRAGGVAATPGDGDGDGDGDA